MILVFVAWALPIAIIIWFVVAGRQIRERLGRLESRLDSLAQGRERP